MSVTPELERNVTPESVAPECLIDTTRLFAVMTYYSRHREQELTRNKLWREKNRERWLQYTKEYRQKNRERLNLQNKEWYQKNRERKLLYSNPHQKAYRRNYIAEIKPELQQYFPSLTCFLCGKQDERALLGISFHEIHGNAHEHHRWNEILRMSQNFLKSTFEILIFTRGIKLCQSVQN
jgi:hypothetical protein